MQNKTTLFNIYGTTEVSSWATCHQIDIRDLSEGATGGMEPLGLVMREHSFSDHIPIGKPLLGTRLALQDSEGTEVCQGFGEIWIGTSSLQSCMYTFYTCT